VEDAQNDLIRNRAADAGHVIVTRTGLVAVRPRDDVVVISGVRLAGELVEKRERLREAVERADAVLRQRLVRQGDEGGPLRRAGTGPVTADQAPVAVAVISQVGAGRIRIVSEVGGRALAGGLEGQLVSGLVFGKADAAAAAPPARFAQDRVVVVDGERGAADAQDVRGGGRPEGAAAAV